MKNKKIITCAGYHGTGSSIVTDYLKEFEEIESLGDFEFRFIQDPNGIADLEDRLLKNNSRLNSDRAIYEYLRLIKILNANYTNKFWKKSNYRKVFKDKFFQYSKEYIEDLVDLKWNGYWHDFEFRNFSFFSRIKSFIIKILFVISREKIDLKNKTMYFSYPIEDFKEKTQKYLNKLFDEASSKNIVAFDQLVPVCNMNRYLEYFQEIKVIVVDRDPRDIYIYNKKIYKEGVVPCEDVDVFIKHFKLLRKHQNYDKGDKEKILKIQFEDIIYKYDETTEKINIFLNIENLNHLSPKQYFNPSISINNTQMFKLYPEYKKDIEKIEKELKDYCYNFPFELNREEKQKIF